MSSDEDRKSPEWQELEHLVAASYESLGYKVTRDINLKGHQIDLTATRYVSGFGNVNLAVEVKHRRSTKLGVSEVTEFKNVAADLRSSALINSAAMVTNTDYTQYARAVVHGDDWIKLIKLSDLEQDLFNFTESLLRVKNEFEQSPIFSEYVPLSAHVGDTAHTDVVTLLESRVRTASTTIVVGDFGSGKTTAVGRLFYNLICRRLQNAQEPYPVLLRLRNFLKYSDIWNFIYDNMRDNQYLLPTRAQFQSRLEAGQLVLILDGFDEIKTGATASDRALYISQLASLLNSGSPCIVTTRPTYFHSFDEMYRLLLSLGSKPVRIKRMSKHKAEVDKILVRMSLAARPLPTREALERAVNLDPLSDDAIQQFVEHFIDEIGAASGATVHQVIAFLHKVYDIRDLMRRPLLLKMIMVTIIEGKLDMADTAEQIGPSTLYDLYTQICAERDLSVRSDGLSVDERLDACRALSMRMHANRSFELSSDEFAEVVILLFPAKHAASKSEEAAQRIEQLLTDIRVCSFLTPGSDGSIRFAHKSFLEFFVAQHFVVERARRYDAFAALTSVELTKEIIYFLASFARHVDDFRQVVRSSLSKPKLETSDTWKLCRKIAMASPEILNLVKIEGGTVEGPDWEKVEINGLEFHDCHIRKLDMREAKCNKWKLVDCQISNSKISDTSFSGSSFEAKLSDVELDAVHFSGERFDVSGPAWTFRETELRVNVCVFNGAGSMIDVKIVDCPDLRFRNGTSLRASTNLQIVGCTFAVDGYSAWYEAQAKVEIRNSRAFGVWIDPADVIALAEPDFNRQASRIWIENVSGILFSSLDNRGWSPSRAQRFRQRHPSLDLIDHPAILRAMRRLRGEFVPPVDLGSTFSAEQIEKVERKRQIDEEAMLRPALLAIERHGLSKTMKLLHTELSKALAPAKRASDAASDTTASPE